MIRRRACLLFLAAAQVLTACGRAEPAAGPGADSLVTVIDGLGREVAVPFSPEHVICSGPGCLRLLTYLGAQDRAVAVDDMEGRRPGFGARPYALANPQFADLPIFGEFRGHDNPELIAALDPQPRVIFKTFPLMGMDPRDLQERTGIPVVVLGYGDLLGRREELDASLRTMGMIMDGSGRAEEVIHFLDEIIDDLRGRTADIPEVSRRSCYVGGIAYRGPHGFHSTQPCYPPFVLAGARNVAAPEGEDAWVEHADVAKEQIVAWDPEVIFVDASTLEADPGTSAFAQLASDPAYRSLTAVRSGEVHVLLPYNWYTTNYGSLLADAYFVGKVLYPEEFSDVDPGAMADSIYMFLLGEPVFAELGEAFGGLVFERIDP